MAVFICFFKFYYKKITQGDEMRRGKKGFDAEEYIKERVTPLAESASSLGKYKSKVLYMMQSVLVNYGLIGLQSSENESMPPLLTEGLKDVFDYQEGNVREILEETAEIGFEFGKGVKEKPTRFALDFEMLMEPTITAAGGDVEKYRAANRMIPNISKHIRNQEINKN